MGTHLEWAYRLRTRERGRLADRPPIATHGGGSRPGASAGQDRRTEHRWRDRGAKYFQLFFAEVRDRVIGAGQLDAATIDAASALLDEENYWTQCWMMTAVWLRKPLRDAPFAAAPM